MRLSFCYLTLLIVLASCAASSSGEELKRYRLEIVAEYPHDVTAYTQGLFFYEGVMYETTGLNGQSSLRIVDLESGKPEIRYSFDDKYFAEGSVIWKDKLYVLTWDSYETFIFDAKTLSLKETVEYEREGWGITTDGSQLIASDGSSTLYFLDENLSLKRELNVTRNKRRVQWLNELEYINGKVWANVYTKDEIVIINPENGKVEGVIDCKGLLPQELKTMQTDVLNGIAYNPATGKIYITGKNWPRLYEIKIVALD